MPALSLTDYSNPQTTAILSYQGPWSSWRKVSVHCTVYRVFSVTDSLQSKRVFVILWPMENSQQISHSDSQQTVSQRSSGVRTASAHQPREIRKGTDNQWSANLTFFWNCTPAICNHLMIRNRTERRRSSTIQRARSWPISQRSSILSLNWSEISLPASDLQSSVEPEKMQKLQGNFSDVNIKQEQICYDRLCVDILFSQCEQLPTFCDERKRKNTGFPIWQQCRP